MAINTALLIAAPMLQDYFVDKDTGAPLSAGVVTLYQDNSRTTLKNWYYQAGSPGAYTYIALPNPMTLSSVGTIVDPNGNDTIPFFYPFSETDNLTSQPYYITVDNSNGERQFTRQNFPFIAETPSSTQVPTLDNYIINNEFWRNAGSANVGTLGSNFGLAYNSSGNAYYTILAPSQHDGFSMPDINYIKDVNGATETITFTKFALGSSPLDDDITPEFYINHNCTASQAGESLKVYQFPISLHVKTLESVQAAITIQAQNLGGNVNNNITLYIYQFLGTGVTSPSPVLVKKLTLTSDWQKFIVPFTFPSAAGATLGNGGDDALYLQVAMPLAVTCDINFALPSLYLDSNVPTNYFQTYDQVDAVINSARTGDVKQGLFSGSQLSQFGWVSCNDGTIGNASSNSTARANVDTWPLFNLLWTYFSGYTHSTTNDICQMFNSSASPVAYGASAIADFNANNQLSLPKFQNRAILGTPTATPSTTYTATNSGGNLLINVGSTANFFKGQPVGFAVSGGGSTPGNLSIHNIAYISDIASGTTMYVSTTYANALASVYIAYSSAGTGTQTILNDVPATVFGETTHTQLASEIAAHSHTLGSGGLLVGSNGQTVCSSASGSGAFDTVLLDSTTAGGTGVYGLGGSTNNTNPGIAFNVMQPSVYMMTLMKL